MERDQSLIPDSTRHYASIQDHEAGEEGGKFKRIIVVIPISTTIYNWTIFNNQYDYNIEELMKYEEEEKNRVDSVTENAPAQVHVQEIQSAPETQQERLIKGPSVVITALSSREHLRILLLSCCNVNIYNFQIIHSLI